MGKPILTLAVVAVICCTSVSATASQANLLVTLNGVLGVTPHMSLAQVDRAWGTRLEVVNLSYTSSTSGYAPLCLGRTHGVAYFYGLGEPTTLSALWFFAGVQTGAHIHIGSTLTALRRAYGRRLTPESLGDGDRAYWLVRQEQPPRRALEFIVPAPEPGHPRIVTRIAFGYKADLEHQDHDIGGIRC